MTACRTLRKLMKRSPSGQACVFVAIDANRGIKFFRDEETRDDNYDRQTEIHERTGLACQTFGKFDAAGRYGFITERATPLVDGPTLLQKKKAETDSCYESYIWEGIETIDDSDFDDDEECDDEYENDRRSLYREVSEVINEIGKNTGIWIRDAHTANMGRLNNGILVPIDFDHAVRY